MDAEGRRTELTMDPDSGVDFSSPLLLTHTGEGRIQGHTNWYHEGHHKGILSTCDSNSFEYDLGALRPSFEH